MNPFRYRGYYYDSEAGFYYLNSRYYDPQTGRFISADGTVAGVSSSVHGYNLFAYGCNNPVSMTDSDGNWPDWNKLVQGALLVTVGVGILTATILTAGAAAPLCAAGAMMASAVATSSTLLTVIGASEVVESFTGDNAVKDFMGEDTYETVKSASLFVTSLGASYMSSGGDFNICFVAGTEVAAERGQVAIEEIEVGDMVWATDPDTGETELKKVVQLFRNETEEWVHVTVNGEEITCTPSHPFYSPVKGWTKAVDLRAGDILVMLNGDYVVIEQVQHELLESPETTYNFEVEDLHTYYVGKEPVLVHNKCGGETSATVKGKRMHNDWDFGSNVKKEVTIPGAGRADGIDPINRIIYELKPNNSRAIRQGWRQLTRYANALEKYGSKWIRILVTYD